MMAVSEPAPGACEYHCTLDASQFAGVDADAVNVAVPGAVTVTPVGSVSTVGALEQGGALTVSVTASLVVSPAPFLKIASNSVPFSPVSAAGRGVGTEGRSPWAPSQYNQGD